MLHRPFDSLRRWLLAFALAFSGAVFAQVAESPGALMLVATPEFSDPLYGATVLIARPIGDGQFIGFILNKPTTITLADAFPRHKPSQKVKAPIFLGGPEQADTLFALVQRTQSPGKGAMQIAPDLFLVVAGDTVDSVIEGDPEHARFLVGAVFWKRGELEMEVKLGAWYVQTPETDLMMRKDTRSLWKELVGRQNVRRNAI